ncbi:MAG: alkaline phosphatase family protein [Planctomycetes bacterium]|nr:alkaline phosphatase family protein [Planctomycetota bacterium]
MKATTTFLTSVVGLAALAALAANLVAAPATNTRRVEPKFLALIVLDGCRPDYLDLVPMPNLDALRQRGTTFDRAWVGQLVNNTPPSHSTIATGCFPRRHGVVSFFWKNPATDELDDATALSAVMDGRFGGIIRDSKVPSFLGLLRAKSKKGVRGYAISSHKYYAAAGMGALEADTILFAVPAGTGAQSVEQREEGASATVTFTPGSVIGHAAPPRILSDPQLNVPLVSKEGDMNGWAVNAALKLFERDPCEVLYLNLCETDEVGHMTGASREAMKPVMKALDAQLGRLVDAYKKIGRYDETVFVVTADHAMIPNRHVVELPSPTAIAETFPPAERAERASQLRPGFVVARPPYLWVKNTEDAGVFAEGFARTQSSGVRGVFYKHKAPNGSLEYLPATTTANRLPQPLIDAYLYLLSTMACPNGPDIVLATEEDTLFGSGKAGTHGGHVTFTWDVQHIPMILAGPGIRAGAVSHAPARLADIAPTLSRLFGLDPSAMDGVVITDALESAAPNDEARTSWVYKEIARYQDALRQTQ